ncbi:MAG TPA: GNAT family N-acetyltransferase [Tepidiformaceae bacterium]
MTVTILPLPTNGPLFEGAIAVYGDAFALPPYSDPDRGEDVAERIRSDHSHRPGFRALVAVDDDGEVAGMTYGYRGIRGQWWHDTVAREIPRAAAKDWLTDSYELVEIAVAPECQGEGVGSALIRELLTPCQEQTCVLSTRADSRAHNLYSRLGFQVVTIMSFTPGGSPFYVMGRHLPY